MADESSEEEEAVSAGQLPKTILLFADEFPPVLGGIAEMLRNLCVEWGELAVEVVVVTPHVGEGPDGVKRILYHSNPDRLEQKIPGKLGWVLWKLVRVLLRRTMHLRHNPCRAAYYRNIIEQVKPDLLVFGVWSPWISTIFRSLPKCDCEKILIAHGAELLSYGRSHRELLSADVAVFDRVYANSRWTRGLLRDLGVQAPRGRILNMGVRDVRKLLDLTSPDEAEVLRELKGKTLVLSLSSLVERKGIDKLVEAMTEVKSLYPDVIHVHAGKGPDRERIQARIDALGSRAASRLLGPVSEALKSHLFRECSVFVMPSRDVDDGNIEGYGMVYLEAALWSKPCVGGRSGGVPDAMHDGDLGTLVNPTSVQEIADAISYWLGHPEEAARVGARSCHHVETAHTWRPGALQIATGADHHVACRLDDQAGEAE